MKNPSHPGELLSEMIEGLSAVNGKKYTHAEIGLALGVTRKTVLAIISKRQSISTTMALRLATAFRNTTPEFWLSSQMHYDLKNQQFDGANIKILWE